ncbi:hypothetical protein Ddye_018130 [Dipteronia dyeriana]|uniref:BED-type domain-containing protein n=1 Tax=Dipteronia dyeriana TaxID=168575 RepID=A0AAD9X162_9ROSI|nr:hypothetical protein Ddye_018130 [Dipteronia dyeriana]
MGRKREGFWKYVENLNGRFLCKFCERTFPGGITRIKSHLSGVRGRDIDICSKVPEDVKLAAYEAIRSPKKKTGNLRSLNNYETEVVSTSAPNKKARSLHQPNILGECKKNKSVVDNMLAKFIISNHITPDFAKMPYLVDLLRSVAEFGPSYEFPSTSVLTSQLIPGIYKGVEEHIGNVKKLFTKTGCSLVMYIVEEKWKPVCINVSAYTPAGFIYTDKILVSGQGMTFCYLVNSICFIIESLGPENVIQCIFDIWKIEDSLADFKEDNFLLSVQGMICRKYPWIFLHENASNRLLAFLPCIYFSVPWIHRTTILAVVIFRYLHEHDSHLLPQRDHTSNVNKEYNGGPGMTMMAIEFFVLRTILEVEKELQALQLPIASESCEGPSREEVVAEIVDEAIHSTEFWRRGKKVVQVLRSLFLFLEFIDGNGSTFGYLYEASKRAEEDIKKHCDGDDQIHCEMILKWFKKWQSIVITPLHAAAAFLNPAYFCSKNFTEDTEMREGLCRLTLSHPPEEREALSKQLQLYRMKVPELFSATAMKMLNTIHPRKWWECFGDPCPILQKLAVRIMSQTCSAPLRQPFFQPNNPVDELRMNMLLMEEFGMVNSQINLEPTHPDRISELPEYADEYVQKYLEDNKRIYYAQHGLLLMYKPDERMIVDIFRKWDT